MRTLELNPKFNLLGQIDLNNVKIALDRDEMEETVGGYHRPGGGGTWSDCFSYVSGTTAGIIGGIVSGFAGPWGVVSYYSGIAVGCYLRT